MPAHVMSMLSEFPSEGGLDKRFLGPASALSGAQLLVPFWKQGAKLAPGGGEKNPRMRKKHRRL